MKGPKEEAPPERGFLDLAGLAAESLALAAGGRQVLAFQRGRNGARTARGRVRGIRRGITRTANPDHVAVGADEGLERQRIAIDVLVGLAAERGNQRARRQGDL